MNPNKSGNSPMNTWWLIRHARESMYKAVSSALSRHQCTIEQYEAAAMIGSQSQGVTVAELAGWSSREKHTVSGLLGRMEKAGLICREKPKGNRHYVYHLTEGGKQVLAETRPIVTEIINRKGEHFSEEELECLGTSVRKVAEIYSEATVRNRTLAMV